MIEYRREECFKETGLVDQDVVLAGARPTVLKSDSLTLRRLAKAEHLLPSGPSQHL